MPTYDLTFDQVLKIISQVYVGVRTSRDESLLSLRAGKTDLLGAVAAYRAQLDILDKTLAALRGAQLERQAEYEEHNAQGSRYEPRDPSAEGDDDPY